jgi:hypothetical protein
LLLCVVFAKFYKLKVLHLFMIYMLYYFIFLILNISIYLQGNNILNTFLLSEFLFFIYFSYIRIMSRCYRRLSAYIVVSIVSLVDSGCTCSPSSTDDSRNLILHLPNDKVVVTNWIINPILIDSTSL